jgi:predicted Rossmann fold nucleotide-binding protein DprA/Smf involved in DNA uptake
VTPNDIFSPVSIWIHQLISDKKANIVVNFSQFFAENFKKLPSAVDSQKVDLPEIEDKIFSAIKTKWALDLSNLMNETNLDADTLMTHLTMLEINNYVFQESPGVYNCLM